MDGRADEPGFIGMAWSGRLGEGGRRVVGISGNDFAPTCDLRTVFPVDLERRRVSRGDAHRRLANGLILKRVSRHRNGDCGEGAARNSTAVFSRHWTRRRPGGDRRVSAAGIRARNRTAVHDPLWRFAERSRLVRSPRCRCEPPAAVQRAASDFNGLRNRLELAFIPCRDGCALRKSLAGC